MEALHRPSSSPSPAPASAQTTKTPSRNKPKEYTKEEIEKWETEKEVISYEYSPSTISAWRLFFLVQLVAAFYNYISDCDEVFNYWEPLHFMQYGRALQTWEYSPTWALRSYFYLVPQLVVAHIFEALEANKVVQFYAVRLFLGAVTALCQTYFYDRIRTFFRGRIALMTLIFMIFSPGFFVAGTAFLPSSFAMCCIMLAHGFWMDKRPSFFAATFMVALASLVGWPFAAMVGVPLAFDAMRKAGIAKFILYAIGAALAILIPSVLFDSWYYGKTVIASYNIIHYNVLGQTEGGSAIYGVEAWSWYIKNTLVNFNLVVLFAVLSLPVTILSTGIRLRAKDIVRSILLQFGVYLWLVLMSAIPHKEERFLFVVYGPLCLAGAIGFVGFFDFIFEILHKCCSQGFASRVAGFGAIIVAMLIITASVSRTYSIYHNYNAPLKVYGDLSRTLEADDCWEGKEQINVCVGKEWYRYTSSYFLPGNRFNLTFIDQGPTSHLPQYFPVSSEHTLPNFNAHNREEMSRYIPLENCHFVVDYDPLGAVPSEFDSEEWKVVASYPFLEQSRSPNPLFRAFYVPFLSDRTNRFGQYMLLQRLPGLAKISACKRVTMPANEVIRPTYAKVTRGNQQPSSSEPLPPPPVELTPPSEPSEIVHAQRAHSHETNQGHEQLEQDHTYSDEEEEEERRNAVAEFERKEEEKVTAELNAKQAREAEDAERRQREEAAAREEVAIQANEDAERRRQIEEYEHLEEERLRVAEAAGSQEPANEEKATLDEGDLPSIGEAHVEQQLPPSEDATQQLVDAQASEQPIEIVSAQKEAHDDHTGHGHTHTHTPPPPAPTKKPTRPMTKKKGRNGQ